MWRPAERIRHETKPGRWPTRAEAEQSLLFSPVRIGSVTLPQRSWVPAMVPWRASEDGHVTDAVVEWYARFAAGRPGAIVVEATGIRDIPSGPLLRIGDDRFVPGLKRLVEAVREASDGETRLFIQIIDFLSIRRRVARDVYVSRFLRSIPPRPELCELPEEEFLALLDEREREDYRMGYRERVTDTHLLHIAELPRTLPPLFAAAARRAKVAGFDGVELHYAHAYTMASFLSARNNRTDGYGGPLENRLRLPLEVLAAVRAAVGADFVVGCRYLADECIAGGNGVEEAREIGLALAKAGIDFLSLSRGGKFEDAMQPKVGSAAYPYTGRSGYECMPSYISDARGPFGRNVEAAAEVRSTLRAAGLTTPTILAGGFHGFEQAEAALRDGKADIIGMARQSLADPDWWLKVRSGHGDQVRLCSYSNYCEALDQKHVEVTCQLWDRLDTGAPGVRLTADGKRRSTAPAWHLNAG